MGHMAIGIFVGTERRAEIPTSWRQLQQGTSRQRGFFCEPKQQQSRKPMRGARASELSELLNLQSAQLLGWTVFCHVTSLESDQQSAPDPRGRTALFIAAEENRLHLLSMLLMAKADVDSADDKGLSLRELVAWWGLLQFLEVRSHKKRTRTNLLCFCFFITASADAIDSIY